MKSKLYGGCRWAVTVGYDPFIFCLFRIKIFQIHITLMKKVLIFKFETILLGKLIMKFLIDVKTFLRADNAMLDLLLPHVSCGYPVKGHIELCSIVYLRQRPLSLGK